MDRLLKDLRYSFRSLLKQPTFTVVAFVTLALGIGANTAIFSVVNALILQPPRFTDPERIVAIWQTPADKRIEGFVSYLNFKDYKARTQSFEDLAVYKSTSLTLTENGDSDRVQGVRISANFLPLLKVNVLRGRNFIPEEERPEETRAAIISNEFWRSHFGGSEGTIGSELLINGKVHRIVGILPADFSFPFSTKQGEVWTTVAGEEGNLKERGAQVLQVIGRLRPNVTIQQAESEVQTVTASLAKEYPRTNSERSAYIVGAREQVVGRDVRRALWLLFGAVGFTLLIACTNVANLLLVRAGARQREIALRAALGASRWQIARQLIGESLLLSLASGVGGLLIAVWSLKAIKYYAVNQLPRLAEVRLDATVLIFTLGVSLLTGLLFSLLPAFKASKTDVNEVLKATSKAATSGQSLRLWRDSLVASEVALSLILLIGAGLMIKSFTQLVNVPPGFDAGNVLTGRVSLSTKNYSKTEQRVAYVDQTLASLKALPNVESAAFVAPMPFSGGNVGSDFRIKGRPDPQPGNEPTASFRSVTPGYFESIRIPLLSGRHFDDQDRRGGIGAAIVNQTLARLYFAGEDPIGKMIDNVGANQNEGDPLEWRIVGVVGDVHHSSLMKAPQPEIYLPFQQNSWNWGNFFVRTKNNPTALTEAFRQQIKAQDKAVSLTDVRLVKEAISETVDQPRLFTFLFGLFGALGLLLTVTGVYGVISYSVSQRTQEIGIRMSLGATGQSVVSLILKQGLVLAFIGTLVGLAISFSLSRLIVSLLFEVKPTDLTTFAIATIVLLLAAFLASYLPARRATKVDPLVALRYE